MKPNTQVNRKDPRAASADAASSEALVASAQYVKGVGPARFELLRRLGISTVGDLLSHYPREYL